MGNPIHSVRVASKPGFVWVRDNLTVTNLFRLPACLLVNDFNQVNWVNPVKQFASI